MTDDDSDALYTELDEQAIATLAVAVEVASMATPRFSEAMETALEYVRQRLGVAAEEPEGDVQ